MVATTTSIIGRNRNSSNSNIIVPSWRQLSPGINIFDKIRILQSMHQLLCEQQQQQQPSPDNPQLHYIFAQSIVTTGT